MGVTTIDEAKLMAFMGQAVTDPVLHPRRL